MGISSALGSSALLPAGLGFRNAIINGDFRINQRGFTSATGSGTYGFDRWPVISNTGTVTYSAQTFSPGNAIPNYEPQNFARVVTTGQTASNAYAIFLQRIEGVRTFAGQTASLSFWAKASSGTPKVAIELEQVFGTGGSSVVQTYVGQTTISTSWVRYTFTFVVPSISGKTIGTNDSLNLNLWVSGGSDFNSRTGSIGVQSNTFDFWGVQLEANYQPTPFEQRPIGVELALCQRYYWESTLNRYMIHARDTNLWFLNPIFPVTMRVAPLFTTTFTTVRGGVHSANGDMSIYSNGWIAASGAGLSAPAEGLFPNYASIYFTGFSGTAGAAGSLITESNGYFTYFRFNAEL